MRVSFPVVSASLLRLLILMRAALHRKVLGAPRSDFTR